ncbi:MAG: hypothetical protein JKY67_20690 [Pseudomonadales bacterium]|nr:hypothetical protein [Pseudomonadales bacterium]
MLEVVPWAGLCVVIVFAGLNGWKHKISGFSGVDTIISDLNVSHMDGNLAYSGKYRQLFVYYFRQYDVNRDHSFLQADDILEKGVDWGEQLSKYRVRYILVENDRVEMIEALGKVEYVNKVAEKVFNSPKVAREIVTYEFVGEFAKDMSKPPLKSTLLF